MVATGETVGLAEWLIDDTWLVYYSYFVGKDQKVASAIFRVARSLQILNHIFP